MDKLEELREWIGELNWEGVGDVLCDVVDKIDELNKPLVVPKGLGMWLSDQCLGEEGSFFTNIKNLEDMWVESNFEDFITDNKRELIEVILGTREYEVEKEKLYVVELSNDHLTNYLAYDLVYKVFFISKNQEDALNKYKKKFTEQEIKDYDERYWAFAVEVAE